MRKPSLGAGVADLEEAPVLGSFAGAMGSVVLPVAGSAPLTIGIRVRNVGGELAAWLTSYLEPWPLTSYL
jgi:hypothetical protein